MLHAKKIKEEVSPKEAITQTYHYTIHKSSQNSLHITLFSQGKYKSQIQRITEWFFSDRAY